MEEKKDFLKGEPFKLAACIVGSFVYSCGIGLFTTPSGLYSGSFMGMSQIIRTLLTDYIGLSFGDFDFAGILFFILNVPVLLLAFRTMSRPFFIKTLLSVGASTFFLSLFQVKESLLAGDILGSAIIGGILSGLGIGIILYFGGSSGGMDIVSLYLARRNQGVSVGRLGMLVNFVVYGICLLLFDVSVAIYSIIYAVFSGVVVDRVHAQNINMQAMIITATDGVEIEKAVMKRLHRGVTHWDGVGAYQETHKTVLYVILSKFEIGMLKQILREHDPKAFVVFQQGVHVHGLYEKHL